MILLDLSAAVTEMCNLFVANLCACLGNRKSNPSLKWFVSMKLGLRGPKRLDCISRTWSIHTSINTLDTLAYNRTHHLPHEVKRLVDRTFHQHESGTESASRGAREYLDLLQNVPTPIAEALDSSQVVGSSKATPTERHPGNPPVPFKQLAIRLTFGHDVVEE